MATYWNTGMLLYLKLANFHNKDSYPGWKRTTSVPLISHLLRKCSHTQLAWFVKKVLRIILVSVILHTSERSTQNTKSTLDTLFLLLSFCGFSISRQHSFYSNTWSIYLKTGCFMSKDCSNFYPFLSILSYLSSTVRQRGEKARDWNYFR